MKISFDAYPNEWSINRLNRVIPYTHNSAEGYGSFQASRCEVECSKSSYMSLQITEFVEMTGESIVIKPALLAEIFLSAKCSFLTSWPKTTTKRCIYCTGWMRT